MVPLQLASVLSSPAVVAAAVLVPLVGAVGLARSRPPRVDLSLATHCAWGGFAALAVLAVFPAVGSRLDAPALELFVVLLGLVYGVCQLSLPVLTTVAAYVTATAVRSRRRALVLGTPAVAGAVWWFGLVTWGTLRPAAAPGGVQVLGPLTVADLATLPTLLAALALVGLRSQPTGAASTA